MIVVRHVVVGVDGSDDARHALDWAIAVAVPTGARVTAVHALGLLDRIDDQHVPTASHRDEIVAAFRTRWCGALDAAPVRDERLVVDGPPVDVILATALERRADLIVVGERGTGRATDLGSTSRRVLEGSDRPVLVVRQERSR